MASYGITGHEQKPIVMGEFGAFRHAYPTAASAVDALVALQKRIMRLRDRRLAPLDLGHIEPT